MSDATDDEFEQWVDNLIDWYASQGIQVDVTASLTDRTVTITLPTPESSDA